MQFSGLSKSSRPMPFIVMADTSSSMSGNKISVLNQSLQDLVQDLKTDPQTASTCLFSLITFGGTVHEEILFQDISSVSMPVLSADGGTPMGQSFQIASARLEDRNMVPERSLRPLVVLCSDGQPTDTWEQPLNEFVNNRRSSQAVRLALAIGNDADTTMLGKFVTPEYPVLQADEPGKIKTFFQFITWVSKSHSQGQDLPDGPPDDLLP